MTKKLKKLKRAWDRALGNRVKRAKLRRQIKALKEKRDKYWNLWGGGRRVINEFVIPVSNAFDAPVTSRKRSRFHPLSILNPGSDHNKANTDTDAVDLGTFNGSALAFAIAKSLGITNYSTGNYNTYTIQKFGRTFQVQILWAVSGHFNHVHVGIKRIG
jgi:hypothetical protein